MRIVSFLLPCFLDSNYVEDASCPVWQALQVTAHELDADGESVLTERMAADDPRAAAFRGHPAIERDHSADYALYTTEAAERADGFGTIQTATRGSWRTVAILREHLDWQLARYDVALPVVEREAA